MSKYEYLGKFIQKTNRFVVSDPTNQEYDEYMITIPNIKKGLWHAWVNIEKKKPVIDSSVDELIVVHVDECYDKKKYNDENYTWENIGEIATDFGVAGIFDKKSYGDINCLDLDDDDKISLEESDEPKEVWAELVKDVVLGDNCVGVMQRGAASLTNGD